VQGDMIPPLGPMQYQLHAYNQKDRAETHHPFMVEHDTYRLADDGIHFPILQRFCLDLFVFYFAVDNLDSSNQVWVFAADHRISQ
jgi:hypothetical protein